MDMLFSKRFELNDPFVLARSFGDSAVVINLELSRYYSIDGNVPVFVFDLLKNGWSIDEITAIFSKIPENDLVRIRSDLADLLKTCIEQQLFREISVRKETMPTMPERLLFSRCTLAVHEDISHLLAMDPPIPALQTTPNLEHSP